LWERLKGEERKKKKKENIEVHIISSLNTNILKLTNAGHKSKDGVAYFGFAF